MQGYKEGRAKTFPTVQVQH